MGRNRQKHSESEGIMATKKANGSGTIRKRADGRWEGKYTLGYDPKTGKLIRKSVYGKTQKEVRLALSKIVSEMDSGTYAEPFKMKVSQWLDEWLASYTMNIKLSTFHGHIPVGQAVAKGVQRFKFQVAVGASLHGIILKSGHFFQIRIVVEGHWQLARGGNGAKENVCCGFAALSTGIPQQQNTGALVGNGGNIDGRASHQAQNYGLSCGNHGLCQLPLGFRQQQAQLVSGGIGVSGISLFPLQSFIQTQNQYGNICQLRYGDGFGKTVICLAQIFHPILK